MPTEVISGLWIGSMDDLKNPTFFLDMEINIIINLTDCNLKIDKQNVSYINLPISSYNINNMKNIIDQIVNNIHMNIKDGLNNVFIYDINGLTIAPLITGIYMMKYGSVTKYDIPVILRSKNYEILINIDDYSNLL